MSEKRAVATITGRLKEGGELTVRWSADRDKINERAIELMLRRAVFRAEEFLSEPFAEKTDVVWTDEPMKKGKRSR